LESTFDFLISYLFFSSFPERNFQEKEVKRKEKDSRAIYTCRRGIYHRPFQRNIEIERSNLKIVTAKSEFLDRLKETLFIPRFDLIIVQSVNRLRLNPENSRLEFGGRNGDMIEIIRI